MWKIVGFFCILAAAVYIGTRKSRPFDPATIRGKRVLITGASSGIGEQLAYQYAKHGASVVITARREALLQKVVENCWKIGDANATFAYHPADMANMEEVELTLKIAVRELGGLDFLILNHAYNPQPAMWRASSENFDHLRLIYDINVRANIHLASLALPELEKHNGSIAVVNSFLGKVSSPLWAPYASSKAGLEAFFNALREELSWQDKHISITNCVLATIDTEKLRHTAQILQDKLGVAPESLVNFGLSKSPSAEECAFEILRETAEKTREMFFPSMPFRFFAMIRDFVPSFVGVQKPRKLDEHSSTDKHRD